MKMNFYNIIFMVFLFLSNNIQAQKPNQMPVYPGCEHSNEQMKCMHDKLLNFIESHFDSGVLHKIKDEKEVNVHVAFIIDESGEIENMEIKSAYPEIIKEMTKTLKQLPKIQPAKLDEKPIRMRYELPVSFEIEQKR